LRFRGAWGEAQEFTLAPLISFVMPCANMEKGVSYLSACILGVGGTPFYQAESSLPVLRKGLGKTLLLIILPLEEHILRKPDSPWFPLLGRFPR